MKRIKETAKGILLVVGIFVVLAALVVSVQDGKDFAKSPKGDAPDSESERVVREMAGKGGVLLDKEFAEEETTDGRIGELEDWMSRFIRSLHWIRNDMEATDATLAAQGQQIKDLATVTNNQAAVIRQNQKTVTALVGLLKQEGVIE